MIIMIGVIMIAYVVIEIIKFAPILGEGTNSESVGI